MKALVLSVLCLAAFAQAGGRLALAEWDLTGPLADVEFVSDGGDRLRLSGALRSGESRVLLLAHPVPARTFALRDRPAPAARWDTGADAERGRARFVRWIEDDSDGLDTLPAGLRARSLPPVERSRSSLGLAAACVLGATLVALLAVRRRPFRALAFGVAGGALAAVLARPGGGDLAFVRVLEGELGARRWLDVRAGAGVLSVGRELLAAPGVLATEPADVRLDFEQDLAEPGGLRVRASRARLHWKAWAESEPAFGFEHNGWRDLDRVRVRRAGSWAELGPWSLSAAPGTPAPSAPVPGWLEVGLPQGVDVLLARFLTVEGPVWARFTGE